MEVISWNRSFWIINYNIKIQGYLLPLLPFFFFLTCASTDTISSTFRPTETISSIATVLNTSLSFTRQLNQFCLDVVANISQNFMEEPLEVYLELVFWKSINVFKRILSISLQKVPLELNIFTKCFKNVNTHVTKILCNIFIKNSSP